MRRPPSEIASVISQVLRALPLCAPAAFVAAPSALAHSVAAARLIADIPAQPLGQALDAFASQTGLQLVYVSGILRDQKSRAASAGLSPQEALHRMLQGTGLRFEFLTPHSIRILAAAAAPKATPTSVAGGSEEVIVTANRRTEALQTVPITVQVVANTTLKQLGTRTFDDFVSYLPGVTAHGTGPAQNDIYVRGLGAGEQGTQGGGFAASFPNVAIYLDEQSAQLPNRNLDVYAIDLERIEVLEGPQGTLFGAGAEAGVLRYITNKPKLNLTEVLVDAGAATTAHGGASYAADAVLNLPLVTDHLAVRAVIYDDRRGGYIDNIPGTFYRTPTDGLIAAYNGGIVPANSPVIDNHAIVASDINRLTYKGTRVEALYGFSDDWSALIAESYQSMNSEGVFAEMATNAFGQPQPDLSVQLFNPSFNNDRFENTALTIAGRLRSLKVVYAGSYLVRNVEQSQDYTAYAHGGLYADYYQCINFSGYSTSANPKAQCFTPRSYWHDTLRNTHLNQELRLSTPDDWRLRGVGGLFYESFKTYDQVDWFYLTAFPYFNPIAPPTDYYALNGQVVCGCTPGATLEPGGVTSINPGVRPPGDGFFNDVTRGYKQRAAYASLDFDLIPRELTLTLGSRYYRTSSTEVGSAVSSFGCNILRNPSAPNPCINLQFVNLDALNLNRTYSGSRSRANLGWQVTGKALVYYTWSQGFRPGVFNRGLGVPSYSPLYAPTQSQGYPWQTQAIAHGGWMAPYAVAPDTLTNNEVGWKTSWLAERLVWNGSLYQENWNDAQIGALDQSLIGDAIINGGNYRVRGLETSAHARLGGGLVIAMGAAWNHSELTRERVFLWADGTPINFSTLTDQTGRRLSNPAGVLGSPLAGAPPFQGNLRIRYEVELGGYEAFAQVGAVHQAHSLATVDRLSLDTQGNSVYYDLPPFTTYDASLGAARAGWSLQLFAGNLTDTRAELYATDQQYYKSLTVNRPRTIGVHVSYEFLR